MMKFRRSTYFFFLITSLLFSKQSHVYSQRAILSTVDSPAEPPPKKERKIKRHPARKDFITFDTSMKISDRFNRRYSHHDREWRRFRSLYNCFKRKIHRVKPKLKAKYRIPRRMHFIWLGSPIPERCLKIIDSWKKFHPDWELFVWTEIQIEHFHIANKQAFDAAKNYGEKSDIWRYEILYRFGGVYVDTDFECLKPFDVFHQNCDFYTGIGYMKTSYCYNGLIGSRPRHPILKACMDRIRVGPGDNSFNGIINRTGPSLFTSCLKDYTSKHRKNVVTVPLTIFYPFPDVERGITDQNYIKRRWVRPESYALHYWAVSWQ